MSRNRLASLLSLPVVALVGALIVFSHPHASAQAPAPQAQQGQQSSGDSGNLKTINNPGGGQIVYGPVVDQSTMDGAMYEMLHSVHGHFGEKPQIGDFFKKKGSNSVATFFTLNAKKQGGGTVPSPAWSSSPWIRAVSPSAQSSTTTLLISLNRNPS